MRHVLSLNRPSCILLGATSALALASPALPAEPAGEAFGFLLGEWEGTGEASAPEGGPRGHFTVRESIQAEAGGHAITLRGTGDVRMGPDGPLTRIHDAIGLVWRHHDGSYRIRSVTMHGQTVEGEIVRSEDGYEWGFSAGTMGEYRYQAIVSGDSWVHRGYYRAAGDDEWSGFMTMSLTRISD